jgi:hypothetical protein
MTGLPITGRCNCGAVRFEIDSPLVSATYCHCTRCQRRTGTASSAQGRLAAGSLRLLSGEDRLRSWAPGDGWEKQFCGDCGSAMFSREPGGESMAVRLGVIDGDPGIKPQWRQWVDFRASWEEIPDDGLPRHPGPPHD